MAARRGVTAVLLVCGASTHAATLTSVPWYCAKDMDTTSIPSLNDSVTQSFGGGVSLADVELLQVGTFVLT